MADEGNNELPQNTEEKKEKKLFTQEEVDKINLHTKRKIQDDNRRLADQLDQLKKQSSLTAQEKEALEEQIENLRNAFASKEELAKKEQDKIANQFKKNLEETTKERDAWKANYSNMVIENSIIRAAEEHGAFNSQQIAALVRPMTQLVEDLGGDGKPTGNLVPKVNLPTVGKDGVPITLQLTPAEAVKALMESEQHGNLFKANLKGGVGGSPNSSSGKSESVEKLKNTDDYMAWRKSQKDKSDLQLPVNR